MPRRFLFHLLSTGDSAASRVPDCDLLGRFARDRDPVAFELLVRRHSIAVWTACRRVLRSDSDAEDAFQATFIVLAQKAKAIRGNCIGGWLYRVAVHAALRVRDKNARFERATKNQLDSIPTRSTDALDSEIATVVHEELALLPEKYRLPVVLCELEGHSHTETATILGWPIGSVSGRLSRARVILRNRLSRRGFAPASATILLVPVDGRPAGAISQAVANAVGAGTASIPISLIAQGVLSTMHATKVKLITLAFLASAGLFGLAGVGTYTALGQNEAKENGMPEPKEFGQKAKLAVYLGEITAYPELDPKLQENKNLDNDDLISKCPNILGIRDAPKLLRFSATDDPFRQLKVARLNNSSRELARAISVLKIEGRFPEASPYVQTSISRAVLAASDLFTDPNELRPWLVEQVRIAKTYERVFKLGFDLGATDPTYLDTARYARLEAEIALYKVDQKIAASKRGP